MKNLEKEFMLLCLKELGLDTDIQKSLCETDLTECASQKNLWNLNKDLLQVLKEYSDLYDRVKTESRYDHWEYLLSTIINRIDSGLEKSRIITNSIGIKLGVGGTDK